MKQFLIGMMATMLAATVTYAQGVSQMPPMHRHGGHGRMERNPITPSRTLSGNPSNQEDKAATTDDSRAVTINNSHRGTNFVTINNSHRGTNAVTINNNHRGTNAVTINNNHRGTNAVTINNSH